MRGIGLLAEHNPMEIVNSAFAKKPIDERRYMELQNRVNRIEREQADDVLLELADLVKRKRQARQDAERSAADAAQFTLEEQELRHALAVRAGGLLGRSAEPTIADRAWKESKEQYEQRLLAAGLWQPRRPMVATAKSQPRSTAAAGEPVSASDTESASFSREKESPSDRELHTRAIAA